MCKRWLHNHLSALLNDAETDEGPGLEAVIASPAGCQGVALHSRQSERQQSDSELTWRARASTVENEYHESNRNESASE